MKFRKVMCSLLLCVGMLGTLAGCGDNSAKTSQSGENVSSEEEVSGEAADIVPEELTLPLAEEKKELSVWVIYSDPEKPDLNDMICVQKLEELTNVHINWITVGADEAQEKFGIMINSGDYPDIICPIDIKYPGGIEKGIEDGVFVDMDEICRKYMPNYMASLESNEVARREATSDTGKLLAPRILLGKEKTVEGSGTQRGLVYRQDILESLGMDVPVTVEEWHQVLLKCKENGMVSPFSLSSSGASELSLAWGVNTMETPTYFQLDGNQVVFGPSLDGYGEYLETMHQWYEEGLISSNFTSGNLLETMDFATMQNDEVMLMSNWAFWSGDVMYTMGIVTNPDFYLQAIQNPVLEEGAETIQCTQDNIVHGTSYVTTGCEDPVLAAKWLDFMYTEEGALLNHYGIEGDTYTIDENGNPQYTEKVFEHEGAKNASEFLKDYCLAGGRVYLGKEDASATLKLTDTMSNEGVNMQVIASEIWTSPRNIALPEVELTNEEGNKLNTQLTALNTLIEEYTVNYILGSDTRSFEEFRSQLYDYGLQECIDIYQAAYERYLQR